MRIGFIGLGNMGGSMALNMMKAGHQVTVNDMRRQMAEPHLAGGAQWADSSAAAAKDAEVVFTSLPGPQGGRGGGARRGRAYRRDGAGEPIHRPFDQLADGRTPGPRAAQSQGHPDARRARQRRHLGARKATLAVMVGGSEADYNEVKPVLDAIGDKVTYIGAIGAGAVAKLVHNMIAICSTQLLAEAFTMGVKAGVSPEALLRGGVGRRLRAGDDA